MSNIPVEPLTPQTGLPKVIPPYSEHDITVPPPLEIPTNFKNQAEVSSENEDRTPTTEGQDVG